MNSKPFLTTIGGSALLVALLALPSSSTGKPQETGPNIERFAQALGSQDATKKAVEVQEQISDMDVAVLDSLDDDEDVQVLVNPHQGWLGVGIGEVTSEKAKELKLPAERGVVLGKIVPESPAAKAGLRESDVILEINGQRVEGTEQFRRMIREIPSGRSVQFTVWRDGHHQAVTVTMGKAEPHHLGGVVSSAAPGAFAFQMPDMSRMGEFFQYGPWPSAGPRLGIDAENLDGEFGNFFGAPEGEGILVRGVFPDSPASKAGLKVGDVITSIDGERVHSIGELREKLVEKKEAKSIKLGIIRNKAALSLSAEVPAPVEKQEHHEGVRTNI